MLGHCFSDAEFSASVEWVMKSYRFVSCSGSRNKADSTSAMKRLIAPFAGASDGEGDTGRASIGVEYISPGGRMSAMQSKRPNGMDNALNLTALRELPAGNANAMRPC